MPFVSIELSVIGIVSPHFISSDLSKLAKTLAQGKTEAERGFWSGARSRSSDDGRVTPFHVIHEVTPKRVTPLSSRRGSR